MTIARFDLRDMFTCSATDDEGFNCVRSPSHDGPHKWLRCGYADAGGHRCIMPPDHPGGHDLAWFDRPTEPGAHHIVRYGGTAEAAERLAATATRVYRAHGWIAISSEFTPSLPWRRKRLGSWLTLLGAPRGNLEVVYEYQRQEPTADHSGPPVESG
jgi:hypothetical protein